MLWNLGKLQALMVAKVIKSYILETFYCAANQQTSKKLLDPHSKGLQKPLGFKTSGRKTVMGWWIGSITSVIHWSVHAFKIHLLYAMTPQRHCKKKQHDIKADKFAWQPCKQIIANKDFFCFPIAQTVKNKPVKGNERVQSYNSINNSFEPIEERLYP